jgi:hypothetical protein
LKPGDFIEFIKKVVTPKDEKFRNQLYIFLICFGISFFIWILIKTSKEYYSNVEYPLVYTNIPEDKLLTNCHDSTLILRIKSKGFRLFSIKYLKKHRAICINLSKANLRKSRYENTTYVLTSPLKKDIENKLYLTDELISILPDTLNFNIEEIVNNKIPIRPDISITYKKQYMLYDPIKLNPDSIIVSGSQETIDTIKFIRTSKIELLNLNENKSFPLKIIKPIISPNIKYSADTINVFIPVEKYTEATIEILISVLNNDSINIITFPKKAQLTYLVALKDYKRIDSEMFSVGINYNENIKNNKALKLKVSKQPDFIRITKIKPEKVEYIILK